MQILINLCESAYKEMCENGIDVVDYDIRQMMKKAIIIKKEIVTCKNCKYWHDNGISSTCDKNIGHGFPEDYFCANGERKQNE